ncbi:MAG: hypothetical protein A4E57_01533 [Syntrophorhabdaceae bacterium PtaU1.Bin034]|nr:MAG: hypothetical protein A4E57_01533 [Syntrophorhabdaceae bacterium PtaU1.Bin034]
MGEIFKKERDIMDRVDLQLKGVRGWLLLLCINLTVLDPSAILINLFLITSTANPYFEKHPEFFRLMVTTGVFRIALLVFSVYAGLSLWKVVPGAVAIVRKYFFFVVLYSLLTVVLPTVLQVPSHLANEMAGPNLANAGLTIVYVAVWYLYLKRSKRVRATYVEDREVEA